MPKEPYIADDGHEEQERLTLIGKGIDPKYVDAKRAIGLMRWAASERIKQMHRISDLVIRCRQDGKPSLAAFIYFYTLEQINTGRMHRPSEWMELDFISGQPIGKYPCSDREFSDASYEEDYDFTADDEYDLSPEYYRFAYNILDEVRIGYMQTGTLDMERYDEYLAAIMANTPACYRRFFEDLSVPPMSEDA